jgi:hypothetical protein
MDEDDVAGFLDRQLDIIETPCAVLERLGEGPCPFQSDPLFGYL